MTATARANEIHITRLFDAPIETVWAAWSDPAQAAHWWGPRGFTTTTQTKDLRVGGHWIYTMQGPDGTVYPNTTTYLEVEAPTRLVYDHGATDDQPPIFRVTVVFSEESGKTRMEMTMALPTPEAAAQTRGFIKQIGGNSTWDRFSEYLEKTTTGRDAFIINRSFDVPIARMFDMWTRPEHVARWLPPGGFDMQFIRADIRTGGSNFYSMSGNGVTMYGRSAYLAIEPPDKLVYTQQFVDADEKIARHPMAPTWPETTLTTVRFFAEGPDATRVTVTSEPYGETTPEELATFVAAKAGMAGGLGGSFDKLEAYLAQA